MKDLLHEQRIVMEQMKYNINEYEHNARKQLIKLLLYICEGNYNGNQKEFLKKCEGAIEFCRILGIIIEQEERTFKDMLYLI